MKPGDRVWITRYLDIIEDKCDKCGGSGSKSVRDDWYGGTMFVNCEHCDEFGLARYRLKFPGWSVDSEKKEIKEIKITKSGTYLVFKRDIYGGPPPKNIFEFSTEEIPEKDVFKKKSDAIKYCKEKK